MITLSSLSKLKPLENKISYALEGSIFIGGAGVQWLRDEFKIINSSEES